MSKKEIHIGDGDHIKIERPFPWGIVIVIVVAMLVVGGISYAAITGTLGKPYPSSITSPATTAIQALEPSQSPLSPKSGWYPFTSKMTQGRPVVIPLDEGQGSELNPGEVVELVIEANPDVDVQIKNSRGEAVKDLGRTAFTSAMYTVKNRGTHYIVLYECHSLISCNYNLKYRLLTVVASSTAQPTSTAPPTSVPTPTAIPTSKPTPVATLTPVPTPAPTLTPTPTAAPAQPANVPLPPTPTPLPTAIRTPLQTPIPSPTPAIIPTPPLTSIPSSKLVTGTLLSFSNVATGEINPAGEIDMYTFEGKAGDVVLIVGTQTSSIGGNVYDLHVEIFDPSGRSLKKSFASGYNQPKARITTALTTNGRYTISVDKASSRSDTYTLALHNVAPGYGKQIAYGQVIAADIVPSGDMDIYTFNGIAGEVALIVGTQTSSIGGNVYDLRVEVFDPQGRSVTAAASASGYSQPKARISAALGATGRYSVVIDKASARSDTYTLALHSLSPGVGAPFSYGEVVTAEIRPGGDMDVYTFDGRTGDVVFIVGTQTSSIGGNVYDLRVEIFDPLGNSIATASAGGYDQPKASINTTLVSSGRHTVVIDKASSRTDTYTLSLKKLNN